VPDSTPTAQRAHLGVFAHLTAPNVHLYRRIMAAFVAAKERFTVHLRPEDVHDALRSDGGEIVSDEAVTNALESLAAPVWGNLAAFPDTSRVTALEDFYRRRMLYQLSRDGEAAERALALYEQSVGRSGALQAVALEDIVILLTGLREAVAGGELDEARVHQDLRALRDRFSELSENAVVFMGSVQRAIDLQDADIEAFLAYKERLIDYLERFISDLVTRGAQIAALLERFTADDVGELCRVAAAREVRDSAPELFAQATVEDASDRIAVEHELWQRRWRGLSDWFVSTPVRESEARLLRAKARSAVPALLAVVASLHDRRSGRSDRSADFLTLAGWFADLPDDAARHRLWRSAFGLTGSRHLSLPEESEQAWEQARVQPSTSWAAAPPVRISAQLRRTGSYERRGRPTRIADRSQARALLAQRAVEEALQAAAARDRLITDGPVRLSRFGELEPAAFRLLLQLLGDGVAALRPGEAQADVTTADGWLRLLIERVPKAPTVQLVTPDGVLSGPDHLVDITTTAPAPRG